MNIIFLDTETTGLSAEDRLLQVAYAVQGNPRKSVYFKPPVKISFEAMSVHHITEHMVKDNEPFAQSECYKELETLLTDHILVAHNAPFDVGMLEREGLKVKFSIDTRRVAQHVLENEERFALQYLRYSLNLNDNITEQITAHDALADIIVLEELFNYLFEWVKGDTEKEKLVNMINLSKTPVLIKKFMFGKYKGKPLADVYKTDGGYFSWLFKEEYKKPKEEQNQDLLHSLRFYLEQK